MVVNGQKQGGNVASYFCLSDGTVVHAVAGPLDAQQFLQEAKWAVEVRKLAVSEAGGERRSIARRSARHTWNGWRSSTTSTIQPNALPQIAARRARRCRRTHPDSSAARPRRRQHRDRFTCLARDYPLPKLSQLYPIVFEDMLKEKLSTLPVQTR